MTDQDHDVEDLIAALRDDLPSRDDERRVRGRLAAAGVVVGSVATLAELGSAAASTTAATGNTLASGSAAASGTVLGAGAAAGSGSIAAGSGVQGSGLALLFAKVAALGGGTKAALVTALAVGAGYPAVTALLPPSSPAVISLPIDSAPEAAARAPEPQLARVPESVPRAMPEPVQPTAPEPQRSRVASSSPAAPQRARVAASELTATPAPPEAVRSSTLEAETALIERALRAARAGDAEGARNWLSEHQRRYPNGSLAPERQRALEQLQH